MGGTITMVTQEGTTITIPAHELSTQGGHSVTMVTTDGSDGQVMKTTRAPSSLAPVHLPQGVIDDKPILFLQNCQVTLYGRTTVPKKGKLSQ